MLIRRLTKREFLIFSVCSILIFVYIGYTFIYKPMSERISILDSKIQIQKKRLADHLAIANQAKLVESRYENYIAPLRQNQPDSREMAEVLAEIESIAGDINLRLTDMKPKKARREEFLNLFSVSLSVEGEMSFITKFLYTLESAPHNFTIDELRLEKRSVRSTKVRCGLGLSRHRIP